MSILGFNECIDTFSDNDDVNIIHSPIGKIIVESLVKPSSDSRVLNSNQKRLCNSQSTKLSTIKGKLLKKYSFLCDQLSINLEFS